MTEADQNTRKKLMTQILRIENPERPPGLKRNPEEIKRIVDQVVRQDLV